MYFTRNKKREKNQYFISVLSEVPKIIISTTQEIDNRSKEIDNVIIYKEWHVEHLSTEYEQETFNFNLKSFTGGLGFQRGIEFEFGEEREEVILKKLHMQVGLAWKYIEK